MTSRPLRAAGATLASLGLILGLGACSSESVAEKFCEDGAALVEADMPDDPDALDDFAKKVNDIEAPDEIKDDWNVLQEYISDMAELAPKLESDDPEEASAAQAELMEKIDGEKMNNAGESVQAYVEKNCEQS